MAVENDWNREREIGGKSVNFDIKRLKKNLRIRLKMELGISLVLTILSRKMGLHEMEHIFISFFFLK